MKFTKRVLSLILCICMIISLPLSLDVAATGPPDGSESENYVMPFRAVQALLVPDEWNTGLPSGNAISLYFTGDVHIDTANVKAYIALVNEKGLCAYVDPVAGKTVPSGSIISIWDANLNRCEALGSSNNYVVTLNDRTHRNEHELCDSISEILDLAQKTKLTAVVRLREASDPILVGDTSMQYPNYQVNGIYENADTILGGIGNGVDNGGCPANGQILIDNGKMKTNCYDYFDLSITTINQAPSLKYVEYDNGNIRSILTHRLNYNYRGAIHTPTHFRVVNSKGQVMYTNGSSYKTELDAVGTTDVVSGYFAIGDYENTDTADNDIKGLYSESFFSWDNPVTSYALSAIPFGSQTRNWTSTYNYCVEKCRALNQIHYAGETYTVALVIDENDGSGAYAGDYIYNTNGDSANNYRIDGLWADGLIPLTATHSNAKLGISDRVIAPILSSDQLGKEALTHENELALKDVTFISTIGQADRVVVEFTKPLETLEPYYSGLRVYNSNNNVPTHPGSDPIQWKVASWTKVNTEGTRWMGTLSTCFKTNSLSGAKTWLANNGYATQNEGTFCMNSGYRLEFALADNWQATEHRNNRKIDAVSAIDGTPLFANDSPFGASEERASVTYTDFTETGSIQIDSVHVYADKYLLIDFNQDVSWQRELFYASLCVYDKELQDMARSNSDYTNYGQGSSYTKQLQIEFTDLSYYGNCKDIIVATLKDGDYSVLLEDLTKANAWSTQNGGSDARFDLRLRLHDLDNKLTYNIEYAVDGITSLDGKSSYLYSSQQNNWSSVYALATHHEDETKSATLTNVQITAPNQALLSFSTAITSIDKEYIYLVDGNTTHPITNTEINGTDVVVTFDSVTLRDGMGIRIDGGADYRIPSSVIQTEDNSVIYANESKTSAYLVAKATEAVAKAQLNGTYYISFETAWSKTAPGDTLCLLDNIDKTDTTVFVVPADVTFDLNGHTLSATYLVSFGNIIDSTNGTGLVKVGKDTLDSFATLHEENTYLPLYDVKNGGYRFYTYDIKNMGVKEIKDGDVLTKLRYGIRLLFDNTDAYTLLQDAANADVDLSTTVTVQYPDATATPLTYHFSHQLLSSFAKQYPSNRKLAIGLNVRGMEAVVEKSEGLSASIVLNTYSRIGSGCGVSHDSTSTHYPVGVTPAQAAVNWINERIANHDLVSFNYNGAIANLSDWNPSEGGDAITANQDWEHTVTYTKDNIQLVITITFNKKHASLEWCGNWTYTSYSPSKRISQVRILDAAFPIKQAVMTTANQGGQNNVYDYQPYSIDLTQNTSYTMQNSGGRSSQGAWPYFDLTNGYNTYGIMGAIGWSGNWMCDFTYADGKVNIEAGMQNTDYQMKRNESLRTPSMVIQFFKGTQNDGHNAWRQLILDQYTPNQAYSSEKVTHAPISINTWGGIGTEAMIKRLNEVKESGQYFEYQWIDAGWYGDYTSSGTYDLTWKEQLGNWYYNPGYASGQTTTGGFDAINEWHKEYGKDTGLIVWFEPGRAHNDSKMGEETYGQGIFSDGRYHFTATYKETPTSDPITKPVSWYKDYFLNGTDFVDYGLTQTQEFITAVVLHFLDDMQCDFYRQDYNQINDDLYVAKGWANKDASQISSSLTHRTGVAEIQYVTGHYKFLDAIIKSGRQIDNCASGGRMLDIEMMKRSIPLWRTDYTVTDQNTFTIASGIRSQGANIAWWLPISGGMGSKEGLTTEYTFRSTMASGITMGVLSDQKHAKKMLDEMQTNRPLMLGDYYILQQGVHEGLTYQDGKWIEAAPAKDFTDTTNAAYQFYCEQDDTYDGYLVAFRPYQSKVDTETYRLQGLDAHAYYEVLDADSGESNLYSGRYLMEHGLKLYFSKPCTSHMIYLTKK